MARTVSTCSANDGFDRAIAGLVQDRDLGAAVSKHVPGPARRRRRVYRQERSA